MPTTLLQTFLTLRRTSLALASCIALLSACGGDAEPMRASDGHTHPHGDDGHDHDHDPAPPRDAGSGPPDGSIIGDFKWELPQGFPRPVVPLDNPMSTEKVELGRHLFYDKRLSGNQTQSCASCHKQERAFADERSVGLGSTGELHTRGSMSLANVGYALTLTWGHPLMTQLERQARVPIFGDQPIELGGGGIEDVEARLRQVPRYHELFKAAFPDEPQPINVANMLRALAAFQRTLISGNSPYDRYLYLGDESALSESAKRGMRFVTSNEDHRFECNHCHGGFAFTDHVVYEGLDLQGAAPPFHQTGLYNIDGQGGYPAPNTGAHDITGKPEDMGMFKAPTLRNIALTAPYMHDGSLKTLSEVIDHYAKGGRNHSARTDPLLQPFEITEQERADIIAFLESLTDQEFITNPKFADPWPKEGN